MVAGVQEGVWPDLRLRGSLLGAEELAEAVTGVAVPPDVRRAGLLAEERRLFYVAATRASERLVVTAVAGARRAARTAPAASWPSSGSTSPRPPWPRAGR